MHRNTITCCEAEIRQLSVEPGLAGSENQNVARLDVTVDKTDAVEVLGPLGQAQDQPRLMWEEGKGFT